MAEDLLKLKYIINYDFKDKELLKVAFTHPSYAAERKLKYDNQRLEYLGDSVLQLVISEYLYDKFPRFPEGRLTELRALLVKKESLATLGESLEFDKYVLMGKGELDAKGNKRASTLADVFEALLGAIYLDAGLQEAVKIIIPLMDKHFPNPEVEVVNLNPKGALQELTQRIYNNTPFYEITDVAGEAHKPLYTVSVSVNNEVIAKGVATKRKTAEQIAAQEALGKLEIIQKTTPNPNAQIVVRNPKGTLQELTQKVFNSKPHYEMINAVNGEGPASFTVSVSINQEIVAEATAQKRKIAERIAAQEALRKIQKDLDV